MFLTIGQDVHFTGGSLAEAIDRGVAEGYREGYLRASLVRSPVDRVNTGDNTPAMVHYDLVPGREIELTLLVKGAGCDNMSALRMLTPAAGVEGMKRFVVETIEKARAVRQSPGDRRDRDGRHVRPRGGAGEAGADPRAHGVALPRPRAGRARGRSSSTRSTRRGSGPRGSAGR